MNSALFINHSQWIADDTESAITVRKWLISKAER